MVGADGSIKSVVRKGDDVIDTATLGPRKGKRMRIARGQHAGMDCDVLAVDVDGQEGTPLCTCRAIFVQANLLPLCRQRLATYNPIQQLCAPHAPVRKATVKALHMCRSHQGQAAAK